MIDKIEIILIAAIFMVLMTGCSNTGQNPQYVEMAVVDAYLFANEPLDDIRLSSLIPYGSEDTIGTPINDADITIKQNGRLYHLTSTGDSGLYRCADSDLVIEEGKTYEIEFKYYGKTISAKTTVPPKPEDVSISTGVFYINEDSARPGSFRDTTNLEYITWNNQDTGYFYVVIENIEENPESIDRDTAFSRGFRFISMPTRSNSYMINPMFTFKQYGRHRAKIYRVNKEYADLYERREQDSRSLNEPFTNINNGLGIFTAASCDSVLFEVLRK
ncbi:MAG: hypothetical protein A2487_11525 [Candidatus Raymondbacteria bacterium RifOxyC12_full_50_8]|nr:MAG: hypothetical protein A2487_11525 [Candidatus Raymondbacteria bacterium RifOxyC12_full_50_8]OGK02730.1 MAG: hypothetical protein A2350_07160 [Candidatus Raymondbacteria bacterium RifOxyB12_full_50_8]